MRTQEEILARIKMPSQCILNFVPEVLICYLDFEHAEPFLKNGIKPGEWTSARNDDAALKELTEYAEFAWEKALGHRGLSAERSVQKMESLAWLLGRDDVVAASEAAGYAQYGCPKLKIICEAFGLPIPDSEPAQRMMRGETCRVFCEDGCAVGGDDD